VSILISNSPNHSNNNTYNNNNETSIDYFGENSSLNSSKLSKKITKTTSKVSTLPHLLIDSMMRKAASKIKRKYVSLPKITTRTSIKTSTKLTLSNKINANKLRQKNSAAPLATAESLTDIHSLKSSRKSLKSIEHIDSIGSTSTSYHLNTPGSQTKSFVNYSSASSSTTTINLSNNNDNNNNLLHSNQKNGKQQLLSTSYFYSEEDYSNLLLLNSIKIGRKTTTTTTNNYLSSKSASLTSSSRNTEKTCSSLNSNSNEHLYYEDSIHVDDRKFNAQKSNKNYKRRRNSGGGFGMNDEKVDSSRQRAEAMKSDEYDEFGSILKRIIDLSTSTPRMKTAPKNVISNYTSSTTTTATTHSINVDVCEEDEADFTDECNNSFFSNSSSFHSSDPQNNDYNKTNTKTTATDLDNQHDFTKSSSLMNSLIKLKSSMTNESINTNYTSIEKLEILKPQSKDYILCFDTSSIVYDDQKLALNSSLCSMHNTEGDLEAKKSEILKSVSSNLSRRSRSRSRDSSRKSEYDQSTLTKKIDINCQVNANLAVKNSATFNLEYPDSGIDTARTLSPSYVRI
jgi:hypothetical protein